MAKFDFELRLVKLEKSLPYIIAPLLVFSLGLQKFINLDKSDQDVLFWSQICFSTSLCHFVYRQSDAMHHRSLPGALEEKAN
ncbi:hypothetical protein BCIN_03g01220 [Botrytis cinerea B05.10]|uniref:Uncharacterized protein n=1 Tax=Botryotinia fuckeliana (strain B05.10) TaxID=332648 RepID=A0A384JBF7_BOTFB|nr:hypothetical protein BCIN_03g01220 [Botrytis cinerea B05.10]ATZ47830.1 hypothetical protein BCIN_03g01220 [Botrytis cinerea B05.10]